MSAPKLKWPHTTAGGTGAAEGKRGYSTERMAVGYYDIAPVTFPNGRHRGYQLHFVNDKGALAGGLWQTLGLHSSPNKAKAKAAEHYAQLLRAKRLEGWRGAPPASSAPLRNPAPRARRGRANRVQAARGLFSSFTGKPGKPAGYVDIPDDDVLVMVGNCEAIAYNAVRNGKRQSYQHEFAKKSRPILAASSDGKRLYLVAGSYRFTARGIVDGR